VLTADEKYAYISSLRKDNLGEEVIYRVDMQRWKPVYLDRPEYSDVFADAPGQAEEIKPVQEIKGEGHMRRETRTRHCISLYLGDKTRQDRRPNLAYKKLYDNFETF